MGLIKQGLATVQQDLLDAWWKLGQRLLEKCVFLAQCSFSFFVTLSWPSSANRVGLSIVKMKRLSFPFEPLHSLSCSLSFTLSICLSESVCVCVLAKYIVLNEESQTEWWLGNYQCWLPFPVCPRCAVPSPYLTLSSNFSLMYFIFCHTYFYSLSCSSEMQLED